LAAAVPYFFFFLTDNSQQKSCKISFCINMLEVTNEKQISVVETGGNHFEADEAVGVKELDNVIESGKTCVFDVNIVGNITESDRKNEDLKIKEDVDDGADLKEKSISKEETPRVKKRLLPSHILIPQKTAKKRRASMHEQRLFQCSDCEKAFTQQAHLSIHQVKFN
jgi:hypothetical protein